MNSNIKFNSVAIVLSPGLLAASACECTDENMPKVASGRLAILHLLLVLLEVPATKALEAL